MKPSRGMGAINPAKMPGGTKKARRDDTDFTEYAKGGEVKSPAWQRKEGKNPAAGGRQPPGLVLRSHGRHEVQADFRQDGQRP